MCPYFPQVQTKLEITTSAQLKDSPGHMLKFAVHIKGKNDVWRIWDSANGPVPGDPGNIVYAAQYDNPRVQEGCVVELDWNCLEGIYIEVPAGGVCSAEWI